MNLKKKILVRISRVKRTSQRVITWYSGNLLFRSTAVGLLFSWAVRCSYTFHDRSISFSWVESPWEFGPDCTNVKQNSSVLSCIFLDSA